MTTAAKPTPRAPRRLELAALGLVLVVLLVAYRHTAVSMVTIWWRFDTYQHAFLVLPIAAWLVWQRRHQLTALPLRPNPALLPVMAGLALLWLLGEAASANAISQFAMVGLAVLAVPALLGIDVARAIPFPLAFVFFCVPLGEFMLPQLIEWTADFVVAALRLTGIPVYREGARFVIPSGSWSVVEACSGVRYLIASFMVGTLYAYLNYRSTRRRMVFMAFALLLPVFANWVRAYLIVMLAHLSDNDLATGVDHLVYGWLFFALLVGTMFWVGSRWSEAPAPTAAIPGRHGLPAVAPAGSGRLVVVTLAALAIVLWPSLLQQRLAQRDAVARAPHLVVPRGNDAWHLGGEAFAEWQPDVGRPTVELATSYVRDGEAVGLYIGYFAEQDARHKLAGFATTLARSTDARWSLTARPRDIEVATPAGDRVPVLAHSLLASARLGAPERRLVAWKVYWVGDALTSSDWIARARTAAARLTGRRTEAAVLVFLTRDEAPGAASARLESFLRSNIAGIVASLRDARSAPVEPLPTIMKGKP